MPARCVAGYNSPAMKPTPAVHLKAVQRGSRGRLDTILAESFNGIYLWHARRTLHGIPWVAEALVQGSPVGLSMFKMLGPGLGYVYYIAVAPHWRSGGIAGVLLDDSLRALRAGGAMTCLASVRPENAASVRLLLSRGFARTSFREHARSRGLLGGLTTWIAMVVAPGECVYAKRLSP
jgi:ribosomal protein S18 acetylase RimI-like enzyme